MDKFEKSSKLDHVCYDIRGPVLDEADRMNRQGMDILKLNIGNPAPFQFMAPDEIVKDMMMNLRDTEGYSDSKGLFSARKAIMQYCQYKKIPNVGIDDIYTGNGVSELITMSMQGLLNPGDEILVPAPDYPLWTASVTLAGGTAVHYICDEQAGWYPDIEDIRKKVTSKTKGIVIINPNNPTGALYPKEVLEDIAEIARQNGLLIFADEIYDRLVLDGLEHTSIASLAPDLMVITFNGLSKSHRIAGYRSGWMSLSGDKSRAKGYIEGLNLLSSMRLCSNVPAQSVIQTALGGPHTTDESLLPGGRVYEQRNYIYEALNDIPGVSAVKPQAAFYIFPKLDIQSWFISLDKERNILFIALTQHFRCMTGCQALVAGSSHNGRFPVIGHVAQISFDQARAVMGAIRISETDIDRDRHAHLLRFPDHIVHACHQLRCAGESLRPGRPHLHNDQFRLRRRSAVSAPFASPAVARGDPCHGSPMSAAVHTQRRPYRRPFRPLCIQEFIDLFGCELPVRLVPQRRDPRRPVFVPEIRIGQIDPAVHDADQHSLSGQTIRSLLHRIDTGYLPPHIRLEIQALRLLDKLHFRKRCQRSDPVFPDAHHCIVVQKLRYGFADLPRRIKAA